MINTVNWRCILRHVVPYRLYGRVNVSLSDLHNTISILHLWEILLVKSQKSKLCGCNVFVVMAALVPVISTNHFPQQLHLMSLSRVHSDFIDMCKPVGIQDPDYLCFHITIAMTSD